MLENQKCRYASRYSKDKTCTGTVKAQSGLGWVTKDKEEGELNNWVGRLKE